MKLRIRDNTLRFRLGRSEIEQLRGTGEISARVVFGPAPDSMLHYSVEIHEAGQPALRHSGAGIRVLLTPALARELELGEGEGVGFEADNGTAEPVRVSVERDFACLKPRPGENDDDAFANPLDGETC